MKSKRSDGAVLFLTTCSLTKRRGGNTHYDRNDAIAPCLSPELHGRLLARRGEVLDLVRENRELKWQGVSLADLEFNHELAKGEDFGGRRSSTCLPAIDRYQGRFFQALGESGREKVREEKHGTLILSGLYGLLRPAEHMQLYSCPLSAEVAETWDRDSLLTEVLCQYMDRFNVLRAIDLIAIDAYRKLIDWQQVRDSGTDVLHCFDAMASGESALTSFGMVLASHLLDRTAEELIDLSAGDRIENVMFRALGVTPAGFPRESTPLIRARSEKHIWQPQSSGGNLAEIVRGGNSVLSPSVERSDGGRWKFTLAKEFRRDLWKQRQQLGRVIEAIREVCESPMSPNGDTVKPLQNELPGMWRYRLGDFRLIYEPDKGRSVVHFLGFKPRAKAYE